MEESRELEFIDKSQPVEKKVDETTRRSFLAKVSGIAAITAMAPTRLMHTFCLSGENTFSPPTTRSSEFNIRLPRCCFSFWDSA